MIWLLQFPAPVLGSPRSRLSSRCRWAGYAYRKVVPHRRLEDANAVSGQVFQLAGALYAVLVAFVVVVVWEQFRDAEDVTGAEASAIADLLRDSTAVPAEFRPAVEQSLVT